MDLVCSDGEWLVCFSFVNFQSTLVVLEAPSVYSQVRLLSGLLHELYLAVFETKLSMLPSTPQSKADSIEKEDNVK